MIRRLRTLLATAAGPLFAVLFGAIFALEPQPWLTWNASESAPIGLYQLSAVTQPQPGVLVAIMPPPALARYLSQRHYLALGVPLLKHVAARAGALVCRTGNRITINGMGAAIALARDSSGRPLPVWQGCHVVERGELFLLNATTDSMDSRYFGSIPAQGLIGRATPLLTRHAPEEPLEWRSAHAARRSTP